MKKPVFTTTWKNRKTLNLELETSAKVSPLVILRERSDRRISLLARPAFPGDADDYAQIGNPYRQNTRFFTPLRSVQNDKKGTFAEVSTWNLSSILPTMISYYSEGGRLRRIYP